MKATKYITLATLAALTLTTVGTTAASAAEVGNLDSYGSVKFIPSDEVTPPVDPENPDPTDPVDPVNPDGSNPNPGTKGPLSLDFASSFDFGTNKISSADETYYARSQTYKDGSHADTANYVQVSDNRGNNAGWTLAVTQKGEFTATTATLNDTLTGAQISLASSAAASNSQATAPTVTDLTLVPDASATIMSAQKDAGAGTWVDRWGTSEEVTEQDATGADVKVNVNKAVSLAVPGATPKDAVEYKTNLNWSLSDVPGA